LKHGDPYGLIQLAAEVFGGCYLATWIPWHPLRLLAWFVTGGFALLFGVPQPWTSGYFIYVSMDERCQLAMFALCGLSFLWMTYLCVRLMVLTGQLGWFEWKVRRVVNQHLKGLENTGIETRPGWDEGDRKKV
jgi:hypothetical protein